MSAFEIFSKDLMGDELLRRDSSRKLYYQNLRTALIDEVQSGGRCELLTHFAGRLAPGAPRYMYLLDAAALWECYDIVFSSIRFPRELGVGFPIPMGDYRRLSWEEADRLNRANALPVAVLDAQLHSRLENIVAYAKAKPVERRTLPLPGASGRATLTTTTMAEAGAIPMGGEKTDKEAARDVQRMKTQAEQMDAELAHVKAERDALQIERDALQADVIRLQNRPRVQSGEDGTLLEMVLNNRITEAAARAKETGSALAEKVSELEELQKRVNSQTEALTTLVTRLAEQTAEAERMQKEQDEKAQTAQQARDDYQKALRGIDQAEKELAEAEKLQADAERRLAELVTQVQEKKRRLAACDEAAGMTRRQLDRLS